MCVCVCVYVLFVLFFFWRGRCISLYVKRTVASHGHKTKENPSNKKGVGGGCSPTETHKYFSKETEKGEKEMKGVKAERERGALEKTIMGETTL